ncbi:hypothetical protein PCANC_27208 [Puccinia coronata f. sp. avenae]|uniref:RING-type domain-containing protein n=1 Tax=Puccinia coronata f. sp. avenae TaxID=200324 RepID=A0A2N5S1S7_9BASI|nr:hypothetical protein PCANC_27208 [Puccinia coronata f. sp. avenae]
MKSEQELVEFSGSEKYARLASAPDEAQPHSSASIVNLPAEPCDVKLDAEGLARSLPSDNPESSHPVTVSPAKHHLSITIDAKTAGDSRTNEVVQTLTSFTDLTEPEPSNTEGQSAIDQIPAALENDHITNSHSDTRPSTSCPVDASIPLSKEAESHAETSQKSELCAICLDDVHASIAPDLKCKHLFHEQCLHGWIKKYHQKNHLKCPDCIQRLAKAESSASDKNLEFWEHLAKLEHQLPGTSSSTEALESRNGNSLSRTELEEGLLTFFTRQINCRRLVVVFVNLLIVIAVYVICQPT